MYDALSEGEGSTQQYKARMNGLAKIIIGVFYLFRNLVKFKTEPKALYPKHITRCAAIQQCMFHISVWYSSYRGGQRQKTHAGHGRCLAP